VLMNIPMNVHWYVHTVLYTFYLLVYTISMGVYTDDDLDDLMKENLRLTRENNKLLRKLRRAEIIGLWLRILMILIIFGVPFLVYKYYIEDYVLDLGATFTELQDDAAALRELPAKIPVPAAVKQLVAPDEAVE
jgi:hypothetical protein